MARKQKNLKDLIAATKSLGKHNNRDTAARKIINNLPLSSSFSIKTFVSICGEKKLIPQADLPDKGRHKDPSAPTHEQLLGTDKSVFFFLAPFSYPNTNCGILFKHAIQTAYQDKSDATPFDSGGLLHVFKLPQGTTPVDFFNDHLLPVPGHEKLLEASLTYLFQDPEDYIMGRPPLHQGPLKISRGDRRRWTHEVRIYSQIPLFDADAIEAVFLMKDRITAELEDFLIYCEKNDIIKITFDAPLNQAFTTMQQMCISYIENKIGA